MSEKKVDNQFRPILVFYWLIPIFSLGIPFIIYYIKFNPQLNSTLVRMLSFAKYRSNMGEYFYVDGWISSSPVVPLSPEFFFSIFSKGAGDWSNIILKSTGMAYALYCISSLFLVFSINGKKLVTYIVSGVAIGVAGYLSLFEVLKFKISDSNSITAVLSSPMTFLTVVFLVAGLVLLIIRRKNFLPARIGVAAVGLAAIAFVGYTFAKEQKEASALADSYRAEKEGQFGEDISGLALSEEDIIDWESAISGIKTYIKTEKNSSFVSSSALLSNAIFLCTDGEISLGTAFNPSDLTNMSYTDCKYVSSEDIIAEDKAYSFILTKENENAFDSLTNSPISQKVYSDEYFSVYEFEGYGLVADEAIAIDLTNLKDDEYDTVMLSMYDNSNLDLSVFEINRAWDLCPSRHIFDGTKYWDRYNSIIFSYESKVENYVLCLEPYVVFEECGFNKSLYSDWAKEFAEFVQDNKDVDFYLYFPSYFIGYFSEYKQADLDNLYSSYELLFEEIVETSNISMFYSGADEYLYYNQNVFVEGSYCLIKEGLGNHLFLAQLTGNMNLKSSSEILEDIENLCDAIVDYQKNGIVSYDLDEYYAVIFGDSIFANYTDESSIQDVMASFSNMEYTNRAMGGSNLTTVEHKGNSFEVQYDVQGIKEDIKAGGYSEDKVIFFIEFGLNDYFDNMPIVNASDEYDLNTFSGAFRTAIKWIREDFPDSTIVVVAPGYVSINNYGEQAFAENGHILREYRDVLVSIAQEEEILYLNLAEDVFEKESVINYLIADGVHYNEKGRYLIGQELLKFLDENLD